MNNKLNLLRRFFNNQYSRNDYFELRKLLFEQDSELEELLQLHWQEFNQEELKTHKDLSQLLNAVNLEMDEKVKTPFLRRMFSTYSQVAAILVIPLLLAIGVLYFQFNEYLHQKDVYVEVDSPAGARTILNLPDGSTVWLNGESQIQYPAVFSKNRKVEIKGEAFFKVHSDQAHPFVVTVNGIHVKATGTEFNVTAYDDDPDIGVILKEGKVAVLKSNQSVLKNMESGHLLRYNKATSSINYSQINADNYSGWINGKLIFENATMEQVVSRMKHWYGVDIEVSDKELLQLHFKATFIDESIDEALKLLQSTTTFNFHFAKRQIRPDGSYENAKIYITK